MAVKIFSFLFLALSLVACNGNKIKSDFKEGDIVFIESKSNQSPHIKVATMSKWTHCGLIVKTPKGLQVVEASKVVKLTSIDSFIGKAKDGNWCVKRPKHKPQSPLKYKKYLNMPYDLEFKFDNNKMYCSELVWCIYKDAGIELCKPRKVSSFICTKLPKVKAIMKKRNITGDQLTVAPVDLYKAI